MPLGAGEQLGHYKIQSLVGKGGMGEVYKALDTQLKREVALKTLLPAFAGDADRYARFQREAEVLASLNHPNIATLYGITEGALVMEFVDGDSLPCPLPLDTAIKYARQIAEALEYAHERGVIHRDLKPANTKINPDGVVKLLDFGLAKALDNPPAAAGDAANSPTFTLGHTLAGQILGTAAYMSPEQVEGRAADRRADIWSFGAVLFEMLAGRRAFEGSTNVEILASVVKTGPYWSALPNDTPPYIHNLIRRCLIKDRRQRLQAIGEARILLEQPTERTTSQLGDAGVQPAAFRDGHLKWRWPVAAALFATVAVAVSILHFRERLPEPQRLEYTIPIPEKSVLRQLALSPDGRYVALSMDVGRGGQLWIRALDSLLNQPLPGTEGAQYPFWSPDSRNVGFFAQGKLKKIAANGGPPQTLCDAPSGRGGTWNREGVIVFAPAGTGGLNRVPAAGGVPVPVTKPDGSPRYPVFLPDGRRFLYTKIAAKDSGIFLASLDSTETSRMVPDQSNAQYLPPGPDGIGHLLFVREQTLMAQPVKPRTLAPAGDLFPVAERVPNGPQSAEYLYTISETGMLLRGNGGTQGTRQLAWFDRTGKQLETVGSPAPGLEIALSRDGKRVATARQSFSGRSVDLWISDLEHDTESELTLDPSFNSFAVWSPDGSKLAFASNRNGGVQNIYIRAANGTGQDELLFQSNDSKVPYSWSRAGRFIVFEVSAGGVNRFALPVSGDHKPLALFQSANLGCCSQLSPDDRWLAYVSTESGLAQIYVQPFAPAVATPIIGKWQVSKETSTSPRWRADGKELFYVGQDQKLMSVEVKANTQTFNWGTPRPLFELKYRPNAGRPQYRYAPSPDGQRFLVLTDVDPPSGEQPVTMVVNWLAAARK